MFLFFLFLTFFNAYANEKSDELLRVVMNADGYINQKVYDEYWKQFKAKPSVAELEKGRQISTLAIQNQYHIWSAVKLSVKNKKIINTPGLEKAINYMKELNAHKSIESTEMMLATAANGTPISIKGQKQYITEDTCDQVLLGIDASIERVGMLLSKTWNPVPKERFITPWMSVISIMPFVQNEIIINDIKQKQYLFKLDEENSQAIAIMKNQRKDTSASTDDCIKGLADSVGLEAKLIKKSKFQSKQASHGSFIIKDKDNKTFLEAICINYNEYLVSIITASASINEVSANHDTLLRNIKLK
ncbi:MAG: hypothetical protein J0647_09245 [Campylobacteraceae bacterium]|nr:hypothetical protein [Campylobacteraceae bacterium]